MISKKELINALQVVRPGLAKKELIEQSASIAFVEGAIATYNDEIAVSYPIKGIDFAGAVPGAELMSVLMKSKDEEVEIGTEGGELSIRGAKFKALIRMSERITLPLDSLKPGRQKPIPEGFISSLSLCLFSAGKDLSKPMLTCIHANDDTAESCDNFRLTQARFSGAVDFPMLLPAVAVRELVKREAVKYSVADGWAHFKDVGGCLFSCRTFEGEYPDLGPIAELEAPYPLKFPPDMDGILDRASVALLDSDVQEVKVSVGKGTVTVKSEGDVIRYEESTEMRSRKEISFSINPLFLRDILTKHSKAEIAEDMSKMRFSSEGFLHVIALSSGM